ncbi:thiamine-phosphate kinase [Gorillibacterium sp. sgz5001074]|uniref:thiamine-phosphate kinase n=1 Tax=Gorillibacterium sp. sgz5001074 TaxID=3446695 RepID=UPI003F673229
MPGLDEFGLIRMLTSGRTPSGADTGSGVAVGIGDDAAVLNGRPGRQWVVSCDTMVQEIHFKPETMTYGAIGFKAMASNISDMAAMGAEPRFAVIALSVPKEVPEERLRELYDGLYECADRYGVAIVGGDTTGHPGGLTVTVTVIGEVEAGRALLRSSAKPGDTVFVTGPLGLSAGGLDALLRRGGSAYDASGMPEHWIPLVQAHQRPLPQVEAGRILAESGLGRALNDVSDGLASEAWELAEASRCTLLLEEASLRITPELARYGQEAGRDPLEWMLYGGEDYQLVGTAVAADYVLLEELFAERGLALHAVGQALPTENGEPGVLLRRRDGSLTPLGKRGYNHFQ